MKKKKEKNGEYPYPSRFGSHKSMVVKDYGNGLVVCEDEFGKYETDAKILDSKIADVNRFDLSKRNAKFS